MFCCCPRTRSVVGSTGTPHLTTKLLKVAVQKSNIGILDSFLGFRRHGVRGEGEGESMVSPCPGDTEPSCGPSFFLLDAPSTQLCTFDCKNTFCCPPLWPHGGRRGAVGAGTVGVPICSRQGTCMGTLSFFAGALLNRVMCKKTSKTTMSWSRGSIQPSLRVNPIQGRTEHLFRKNGTGPLFTILHREPQERNVQ